MGAPMAPRPMKAIEVVMSDQLEFDLPFASRPQNIGKGGRKGERHKQG
jgi:hypothetical protein